MITDPLGSIILAVNVATGAIAQKLDYDEFGNVTQNTNPDFTPFSFCGGLYDAQTKLVRFGARDYDATSGRWTSKDPIGFNGGVSNLFEYCVNDPVNQIDIHGLQAIELLQLVEKIRINLAVIEAIAKEELAKRPMSHNDIGDAMRHAEWIRRSTETTNAFYSWLAGTGHEIEGLFKGQPLNEMLMDLHNNAIGREAGSRNSSVDPNDLWTLPLKDGQYNPYKKGCGK